MADRRGNLRVALGWVRLAIVGGFVLFWGWSWWYQCRGYIISERAGLLMFNCGPGGADFEVVDYPVKSPLWSSTLGTRSWSVFRTPERSIETSWLTTEATRSWWPFVRTAAAPIRSPRGRGHFWGKARILFVPHWCVYCFLVGVLYGRRLFGRRERRGGGFEVIVRGRGEA